MRRSDAPPAGWYPDPENRTRLRWWDGLDWTDIRRAVPSEAEVRRQEELTSAAMLAGSVPDLRNDPRAPVAGGMNRADAQQLITEVRDVARAEVDRAAQEFTHRAQSAIRSVSPLIDDYTNQFIRWVKFAAIFAIILLVAWFTFQTIAQASLFEWIGDRIDNIFDDESSAALGKMSGEVSDTVRWVSDRS